MGGTTGEMQIHPNWRSPVGFLSGVDAGVEEVFAVAHDIQVDLQDL